MSLRRGCGCGAFGGRRNASWVFALATQFSPGSQGEEVSHRSHPKGPGQLESPPTHVSTPVLSLGAENLKKTACDFVAGHGFPPGRSATFVTTASAAVVPSVYAGGQEEADQFCIQRT